MILSGLKNKYTLLAVFFGLTLLTLTQCKRPEEPIDNIGTPVFSVSGTVDGAPLKIEAGKDSFYMYTGYFYDTNQQTMALTGTLRKTNCANCGEQIQVTIYDSAFNNGTLPVLINQALANTNYNFIQPAGYDYTYKVQFFEEDSVLNTAAYTWDLQDGQGQVTTKDPVATYTDTSILRTITHSVRDVVTNCTKTTSNKLDLAKAVDSSTKCIPNFGFTTLGTDSVRFFDLTEGKVYSRTWFFGTGDSILNDSTPFYLYSGGGTFPVTLKVSCTLSPQDAITIDKPVVVRDPTFSCLARFSYSKPVKDSILRVNGKMGKVLVRYVDKNGEEYRSDDKVQPAGSFFTILSHRPYDKNELGQKTELIEIRFRCRVYKPFTSVFKDIEVTYGVMAVAYP